MEGHALIIGLGLKDRSLQIDPIPVARFQQIIKDIRRGIIFVQFRE